MASHIALLRVWNRRAKFKIFVNKIYSKVILQDRGETYRILPECTSYMIEGLEKRNLNLKVIILKNYEGGEVGGECTRAVTGGDNFEMVLERFVFKINTT